MWFVRTVFIVGLACGSGCSTTERLRQRMINQGSTLPELQYQQVLNNLAQFAVNPSALPWHVNFREGTSQVTDFLSGGAVVDLAPAVDTLTHPQLIGSRTAVAQWGASPVIDATELRLLQIAYRRAHGFPDMLSPEFLNDLAHELKDEFATDADLRNESQVFYQFEGDASRAFRKFKARTITTNDAEFCTESSSPDRDVSPLARNVCRKIESIQRDLARIQPGWFNVGRRRDVPKDACYVGKCGHCYVWVCPDGRAGLTEFTLTVLKLSALIKETQTLINPGSVKFSPGDMKGG